MDAAVGGILALTGLLFVVVCGYVVWLVEHWLSRRQNEQKLIRETEEFLEGR